MQFHEKPDVDQLVSDIVQADGVVVNWSLVAEIAVADDKTMITVACNETQNVVSSLGLSMALSSFAQRRLAQGDEG